MQARGSLRVPIALLAAILLSGVAASCPSGSLAATGDMIVSPFGPIVIETCVTETGGTTTYTYQITHAGIRPASICRFQIPGLGTFATTGTTEPLGLTMSMTEASGCATWWVWKGVGGEILPGEVVAFSISVDSPAMPTRREAHITFCDGTKETAEVLVPSACDDLSDDAYVGCFCGESATTCEATASFEGDGTRIHMLGADRQVVAVCGPSWLRHGWSFGIEDIDRYDFRLEIDGVEQALQQRIFCVPGETVGSGHLASQWYLQFPADYFEAGRLYEFLGQWLDYGADPGERVIYESLVEVQALPCLVPVTMPVTLLPDLACEILAVTCECGWTPQQDFECEIAVVIAVTNNGTASSDVSSLRIVFGASSTARTIGALAPGESETLTIRKTVDVDPASMGKCSPEIEATADFNHVIEESNEENNTDTACCQ